MAIDRVAFQRELWQRLQDAANNVVKPGLLGVAIGAERWVIALEQAEQVLPLPRVHPVPRSVTWFRGVVHVRGNIYGIVDLAHARHGKPTAHDGDTCIILLANRIDMPVGLLVSRTLGLQNSDNLKPVETIHGDPRWVRRGLVDEAGLNWHELDVEALMGDPAFNNIAA